jgi:nucleotide-binding universal stress UspA family protein
MLARIGVAVEFRFISILPLRPDSAVPVDRDQLLAALETQIAEAFADTAETVKVYVDVLKGPLLDRLLEFCVEQEVDVILVGHDLHHSGRRALARRLAMKAPCSVWMVPDEATASINSILVPIDFSRHAADTLAVATSLARMLGVPECLALHVYFAQGVADHDDYDEVVRGQEQQAFTRFLEGIDCQGVQVEPLFVESPHVPQTILRIARERGIDLIIMGTRGRTRSAAILLGSETDQTLVDTQTPLLVVKHFGPHLGWLRALLNDFRTGDEPRFG